MFSIAHLKELDLSFNALTEIPRELFQLVNLESLDISYNRIHKITSRGITDLKKLRVLNLERNLLAQIPFSLAKLHLKDLNLSQNLLWSYHTYPKYLMEDNNITVQATSRGTKLAKNSGIDLPYCRLCMLGDKNACMYTENNRQESHIGVDVQELMQMLQEFHLVGESYILSRDEKEILFTQIRNEVSYNEAINTTNWFPTQRNESTEGHGPRRKPSVSHLLPQAGSILQLAITPLGTRARRKSNPEMKFRKSPEVSPKRSPKRTSRVQKLTKNSSCEVGQVKRSPAKRAASQLSSTDPLDCTTRALSDDSRLKSYYNTAQNMQYHISCSIFEPSCIYTNILISGSFNRFPLILVFEYDSYS